MEPSLSPLHNGGRLRMRSSSFASFSLPSSLSSFPFHVNRDITCTISFLLVLLSSFLFLYRNSTNPFQGFISFRNNNVPSPPPPPPPPPPSYGETCDYSNGIWVRDEEEQSRSYKEDCRFLDRGFQCRRNGRNDSDYLNWRWQPYGCDLPRFNATKMLEHYKNKRIVFAGDSIGRNQWESMICKLSQGVEEESKIYEQNGNPITKHKGYLSIKFHDQNLTVEYYRVPFLVVIGRPPVNSSEQVKKAIHVDRLHWYSRRWIGADVVVFNAGHWWNEDKTQKMGFYFQEGEELNMTMGVREAFRRTLQTLKKWILQNLQSKSTHVVFRTYSPVHFRNRAWNDGGQCDLNTRPITNHTELQPEPWNDVAISNTLDQMKKKKKKKSENTTNLKVQLLNITYLTDFRNDGHPSKHREPIRTQMTPLLVQDCSHWCLPGVPDTWNDLLYAHLLSSWLTNLSAS